MGAPSGPDGRRRRRRRLVIVGAVVLAASGWLVAHLPLLQGWRSGTSSAGGRSSGPFSEVETAAGTVVRVPNPATLPPLRSRIVEIAESQVGYRTDPPGTYCNKYSAYWQSGADDCGNGNLSEEWCADFAAWVWQKAGVPLVYQYINGDLNSSAASFYEWGEQKGTWHPLGSGYVPEPGDVAVYGLDAATLYAAHVAIVIGFTPGDRGPVAVNGDGDLTAFSAVEVRADEYLADTNPSGAPLSGYVSPD